MGSPVVHAALPRATTVEHLTPVGVCMVLRDRLSTRSGLRCARNKREALDSGFPWPSSEATARHGEKHQPIILTRFGQWHGVSNGLIAGGQDQDAWQLGRSLSIGGSCSMGARMRTLNRHGLVWLRAIPRDASG